MPSPSLQTVHQMFRLVYIISLGLEVDVRVFLLLLDCEGMWSLIMEFIDREELHLCHCWPTRETVWML